MGIILADDETPESYAIKVAWKLGFAAGELALATRCEALDGAWRHIPAPTWEQQVQRRITEAECRYQPWHGLDNGDTIPAHILAWVRAA